MSGSPRHIRKDEAVSFLGDNPDEIRRSIARDEIRASPAYKKWPYAEVFMNAGRGDLLQKAQDAEKLALQGQLGGGEPGDRAACRAWGV